MTKKLVQLMKLEKLDTNTVSDALDFLGLEGATFGIRPLWDCKKIVGLASTVKLGPKENKNSTVHLITPVIDAIVDDDRVLVIAGGTNGVSCWGDIIANAAKQKQIQGTVIDGCSRDIDGSKDIEYPLYGKGVTMISARNRIIQLDSGCPILYAGVTVNENDYVIADRCGTVFIPSKCIDEVLALAEKIDARQNNMLKAVRSGKSVAEVMHDKKFEAINKK
ncbi:MAG: RraA family protein [Enterobacterales bacterium]|nr:RraA family protein [Enterobacterales bacterium]